MSDKNIDIELKNGIISADSYKDLLGAEIYGTATPMQWLIAKLSALKILIKSGMVIKFDAGDETGSINTEKEYFDWCEKHFPSAYRFIK